MMSFRPTHKRRFVSRRDQVMCLLTPVSIPNQSKVLPKNDHLFTEEAPTTTYHESFRPKALRRLSDWTFYSPPTQGEEALSNYKKQTNGGESKKLVPEKVKPIHKNAKKDNLPLARSANRKGKQIPKIPMQNEKQIKSNSLNHKTWSSNFPIPKQRFLVGRNEITDTTESNNRSSLLSDCEILHSSPLTNNAIRKPYCSIGRCRSIEPGKEFLVETLTLKARRS